MDCKVAQEKWSSRIWLRIVGCGSTKELTAGKTCSEVSMVTSNCIAQDHFPVSRSKMHLAASWLHFRTRLMCAPHHSRSSILIFSRRKPVSLTLDLWASQIVQIWVDGGLGWIFFASWEQERHSLVQGSPSRRALSSLLPCPLRFWARRDSQAPH